MDRDTWLYSGLPDDEHGCPLCKGIDEACPLCEGTGIVSGLEAKYFLDQENADFHEGDDSDL